MAITNKQKAIEERIEELTRYIMYTDDEWERLVLLNDKRKLYEEMGAEDEADELSGTIIERIKRYIEEKGYALTDEERVSVDKMLRQNYIVRGRNHIDEYWIALEYNRRPENMFYIPRRKVLRPIIEAQQELLEGKLDLLAISQPKRTGKTSTSLGLITMMAGREPRKGILASGAGSALVNSFYKGIQEFITSPEYNFSEIFPNSPVVDTSAEYMTIDLGVKKRFPSITCRSIDGAIVGNTEASSLIYLDDCVEGFEEARNYARLEKKWETIRGDVLGRRVEHCPILICGTRYSVKDPIGRLIDVAKEVGWRYKVLEVPALDENDESNWDFEDDALTLLGFTKDDTRKPQIKGSFSTAYYRNERKLVSSETWESEFQQKPIETKGLLFHEEEMNWYDNLPDGDPDAVVMVVDVAGDGTDSTSAPVGYVYGRQVYIDDWFFDNGPTDKTKPALASYIMRVQPRTTRFESNNGGKEYGVNVKRLIDDQDPRNRLHFEYKVTKGHKETKIYTSAGNIKEYFWFRRDKYKKTGSPYYKAMKELFGYSAMSKNAHDDSADSLAMLELFVGELSRPQGKVYMLDRNSLGI